jgi:hypothetical protein
VRILVVEDDREHREALQHSLGQAKGPCPRCIAPVTFEVETASTIAEARQQIQERGYDFVLLDINISGELEAKKVLPLLNSLMIPYAFYADSPGTGEEDAPTWGRGDKGVRMDLVSKICDHYHAYTRKHKKQLSRSGRFCFGRVPMP